VYKRVLFEIGSLLIYRIRILKIWWHDAFFYLVGGMMPEICWHDAKDLVARCQRFFWWYDAKDLVA
jgi:hypothetical protein